MQFSAEYFAVIANSTLRMMTPLLYASLAAAVCAKVRVLNIAMEGAMTLGAFFAIVVNHFTSNVLLSVLAAVGSSVLLSAVLGVIIIRFKASAVVAGMAVNTSVAGLTTYLLAVIFNSRGVYSGSELASLPKVRLPVVQDVPVLSTVLGNLTMLDYLAFASAVLVFVFLYKTVRGYRVRAVGINPDAARSLGTPVESYQFAVFTLSGVFCGLAGCLLSMGTVTLFIENIASGRGYIAMAANSLGRSHPLGVMLSSFFFGIFQALGNFLQNTSLKTQITSSIPYVATLVMLVVFSVQKQYANQKRKQKAVEKNAVSR